MATVPLPSVFSAASAEGAGAGGGDDDPFANPALLALSPKIPALLSMAGSYVIMREVIFDLRTYDGADGINNDNSGNTTRRRRRSSRTSGATQAQAPKIGLSRTLLRTLLALSIADVFYSLPWFATTWMVPSYVDGGGGTDTTCAVQGTIFQVGFLAAPTFNVLYALYSLLMVRYQWNSRQFRRWEPGVQVAVWLAALVTAIVPIPLAGYNSNGQICWMGEYPSGCSSDPERYGECTRGGGALNTFAYSFVFYVASCILAGGVLMCLIYRSVWSLETRLNSYKATWGAGIVDSSNNLTPSQQRRRQQQQQQQQLDPSSAEFSATSTATSHNGCNYHNNGSSDDTFGAHVHQTREEFGAAAGAATDTTNRQQQRQQGQRRASESSSLWDQAASAAATAASRKRSNAVREHAIFYMGAFLFTYALSLTQYVIMLITGEPVPPALDFFAFILLPMQGFFNCIQFCHRRPDMATREGLIFRKIIFCWSSCCCWLSRDDSVSSRSSSPRERHQLLLRRCCCCLGPGVSSEEDQQESEDGNDGHRHRPHGWRNPNSECDGSLEIRMMVPVELFGPLTRTGPDQTETTAVEEEETPDAAVNCASPYLEDFSAPHDDSCIVGAGNNGTTGGEEDEEEDTTGSADCDDVKQDGKARCLEP